MKIDSFGWEMIHFFFIEPEITLLFAAAIEARRWTHSEPNYSSPQAPTLFM